MLIEFDYQSDNYRVFVDDFYQYSGMSIPLVFVTEEILESIANNRRGNYFRLHSSNANDYRDHYFMFNLTLIGGRYIYEYVGHKLSL